MIRPRSSATSDRRRSRSGPSSEPSRSIAVTSKVSTPVAASVSIASTAGTPARPRASPRRGRARRGRRSRRRSGRGRSAPRARPRTPGRGARPCPTTTRAAPVPSAPATATAVRRPPPTSTCVRPCVSATMAAASSSCRGSPARAPSRSTTWSHVAPQRGEPPRDGDRIVAVRGLPREVALRAAGRPGRREGRSPAGARTRRWPTTSLACVSVLARYYASTRRSGPGTGPTPEASTRGRLADPGDRGARSTAILRLETATRPSASSATCARSASCATWPSAGRSSGCSTSGLHYAEISRGPAPAPRRSPGSRPGSTTARAATGDARHARRRLAAGTTPTPPADER